MCVSVQKLDLQDCCKFRVGKCNTARMWCFSNLISSDFLFKALLFSYGVICSPRMLLRFYSRLSKTHLLLTVDLLVHLETWIYECWHTKLHSAASLMLASVSTATCTAQFWIMPTWFSLGYNACNLIMNTFGQRRKAWCLIIIHILLTKWHFKILMVYKQIATCNGISMV